MSAWLELVQKISASIREDHALVGGHAAGTEPDEVHTGLQGLTVDTNLMMTFLQYFIRHQRHPLALQVIYRDHHMLIHFQLEIDG